MIEEINEAIEKEKKIIREINLLSGDVKNTEDEEKQMIESQINRLRNSLKEANNDLLEALENSGMEKPLEQVSKLEIPKNENVKKIVIKGKPQKYGGEKISEFDKQVIKRLKRKEREEKEKKEIKPSEYVKFANKLFSSKIQEKFNPKKFVSLEKDLIKSNLGYTPVTYLSIMRLTIIISAIVAFLIFVFFLFFDFSDTGKITLMSENLGLRFLKTFWILIVIPAGTLLFMYLYPSMERRSLEEKLNQELPFATIHMAAISGSRIEPTKIFMIVAMTKEYPHLEKELNKLLNEINVYGYDLVTALKDSAVNSPSQKLADLFNGLATTITSGGDLYDFFDKRAQTLLFEYRLDREKQTKSAETFMDIYISVVIAAPMILMLLLMMMKISGLGVSLSTSTLTFLVVGGVSMINIFFLVFLQLKQPAGGAGG